MVTTGAQSCPAAVLLEIFGHIAPWIPAFYNVQEIEDQSRARDDMTPDSPSDIDFSHPNATLSACARVCRRWKPPAQLVLYRELFTMTCGERDADQRWSTIRRLGILRNTLTTTPGLALLVHTLQIGIECDCERDTVYASTSAFVKCVAACLNLVHLDVTLGCVSFLFPKFYTYEVSELERLTNIRHLSIRDSLHFKMDCLLEVPPTAKPLRQLVALWPTVEVLSLRLGSDRDEADLEDADDEDVWEYSPLTRLRELRLGDGATDLARTVMKNAPNLETVVAYLVTEDSLEGLPQTLKHLAFEFIQRPAADISDLRQLQTFTLLRDCTGKIVVDYIRQLPRSIQAITIPSNIFLHHPGLQKAIQHLPHLSRLVVTSSTSDDELSAQRERYRTRFPRLIIKSAVNGHLRGWNNVPRMQPLAAPRPTVSEEVVR